ncbi:hypothetical protein BHE97_19040 [Aeromicrobium sp. PE09-221]|uniref:TetR/AcrR family transcriptional regulator n=1 Tax=Aeromicrobium sp. PE09-221 TaxID=1898043 RepID=UPI000B3E4397|nr:TetR/AcrR family transcriptional regulator [Aeromicrobium sp. PE09-221]OUZ06398.1 hypothetical protein BHE97_19040 [Aeromicrobium sp. PE09-221]
MAAENARRERNKAQKRERITAAASRLFATQGFAATTTAQIAEEADVSHGTLFRYAATKAELLLMAGNTRFREALGSGRTACETIDDPVERLTALVSPMTADTLSLENLAAYQRNVLDGSPDEEHRAEALRLVDELIAAIADILRDAWRSPDAPDPRIAAEALYASLHVLILRTERERLDGSAFIHDFREHATLVVRGYLTTPRERTSS